MNYRDSILMRTQRGLDVFNYYMPFKVIPRKKFKSPFYNDTKPSCHVYLDPKTGYYRYKDFGASEYSGDCFWFVATMFNYDMKNDFMRILSKVTIQFRPSYNQTKNPEVILGIFCIGMAEVA